MAEHTPTPWELSKRWYIRGAFPDKSRGMQDIAGMVTTNNDVENTAANAAFIVKACNEHDALRRRVAVLEMIIREDLHPDDCSDVMNQTIVEEIHALTPPAGRAALQEAGR